MFRARVKPSVFVGSSSEGLGIAQAIQVLLDPNFEVELWSQGVFGLTQGTLESLILALDRFDFAILVLTADDMVLSRGSQRPVARDNVLFELGLFVGGLGRDRTFMLYDRKNPPILPTDLAGITPATFEPHSSGNIQSAIGAACTQMRLAIDKLGVKESQKVKRLTEATVKMEGAGSNMRDLIGILARSRKVELGIITAQFGPLINPEALAQVKQDIIDLESILAREESV